MKKARVVFSILFSILFFATRAFALDSCGGFHTSLRAVCMGGKLFNWSLARLAHTPTLCVAMKGIDPTATPYENNLRRRSASGFVDFSEHENSVLQEIFRVRLEARKFSSNSESLKFVRNSRSEILSDSVLEKISNEAKITFENFFVWEEFHFLWEENPDNDAAWNLLDKQYKKCMQYNAAHLDEEKNIYHSLSMLELANSFMPKMKFSDVVKIGLEEKKFYDSIIEKKSANCTTYFNAALWYHFAPAIGGGSESKAEKYFSEALKKASTDYEKFFANFYFSQFEFDRGETERFEKYFSEAEKILPGSGFLEFTRKLNKSGFSYLEYTKNREKVEKSLNRRQ